MRPKHPLPLAEEWPSIDAYLDTLLTFTTSSDIFRQICGGVHILDFLTREPDLYTSLIPSDWRTFFAAHEIKDILDLLVREDIYALKSQSDNDPSVDNTNLTWRGSAFPPPSLVDYIYQIRRLNLVRDFAPPPDFKKGKIPARLAVGMRPKKYHEVENFANYVHDLCTTVEEERGEKVSHIVDFGSGQNYLGRTLASDPYDKHIIAIERKHQFISGASRMDACARIKGSKDMMSKDSRRRERRIKEGITRPPREPSNEVKSVPRDTNGTLDRNEVHVDPSENTMDGGGAPKDTPDTNTDDGNSVVDIFGGLDIGPGDLGTHVSHNAHPPKPQLVKLNGSMNYIEHDIKDGYLEPIIKDVVESPAKTAGEGQDHSATSTNDGKPADPRVMVISLHSCGNLLHHGIRSLVLNPSVVSIAMIGCCYNLVTERLGPATYKLPSLRSLHPRLTNTANAFDPHGFPMSKHFETFPHDSGTGVKLNITAREMAMQAPSNWTGEESESFFTRHFYRTLLQRMLVDKNIISRPIIPENIYDYDSQPDYQRTPLVVGSLRKHAFTSFTAYVRAAVAKLNLDPQFGEKVQQSMGDISEEEIDRYATEYREGKKNLAVVWSMMAFSASIAETLILVDRWQFLREHESVKDCWVEPVFDYGLSPRNLAVIGIKK